MADEYTCVECKGTFEKAWSDEKAEKEAQALWGHIPPEHQVLICDDCFRRGNFLAFAKHLNKEPV